MEEERNSDHSNELDDDGLERYGKYKPEIKVNRCETLDEGTFAFMHWLNSKDKKSLASDGNSYSFT